MNPIKRAPFLLYLFASLLLMALTAGSYFGWVKQQENRHELQRLNRQLAAIEQQSISLNADLEHMLDLLEKTHDQPALESNDPARWLSAIRAVSLASVDSQSVRARVLTDQLVVLGSREGQSVVEVPLEFDLMVADKAAAVAAISRYGDALGAYSSIENCHLQLKHQLSVNQGLRLRCRVLKYATQSVAN